MYELITGEWLGTPFGVVLIAAFTALIIITVALIIKAYSRKPAGPYDKLIGQVGLALSPIDPHKDGQVNVYGEIWNAGSAQSLEKGAEVEVLIVETHPLQRLQVRAYHRPIT